MALSGTRPLPRFVLPGLGTRVAFAAALLPVVAAAGAAAALAPTLAALSAAGLALGAAIVLRPALAGYLLVGVTPLIVGIDRGKVLPVLRPNEALLLLAGAALLARTVWTMKSGVRLRPRLGLVTTTLVLMAVFNSFVPLLAMAVRGRTITGDDLMYSVVLWKYLALYAVVRASIRTDAEITRCIWIAMTAASVVAVIAILQAMQLFGVPQLLNTFYSPFGNDHSLASNRGSSTLALPAATADLLIINLALVSGCWRRYGFRQPVLAAMAGLFVVGALASGQFSGAIGLVVAMIAIGVVSRRGDLPLIFGAVGLLAIQLLRPVIARRLSGFQRVSGLPESWEGRLHNLRSYFWPRLFSDGNALLGVQPAARVPGPRSIGIDWVWIESGYTWLLWGGGIPLLLAFLALVGTAVRLSWRVARRPDGAGIAATGVFVAVVVITLLMAFDPHITYRGSADLLFCLLAMTAAAGSARGRPAATATAAPRQTQPRPLVTETTMETTMDRTR
jgi:hypothetical protein